MEDKKLLTAEMLEEITGGALNNLAGGDLARLAEAKSKDELARILADIRGDKMEEVHVAQIWETLAGGVDRLA